MSVRIGITGGIGSGKSAVTAYLRSLGEKVICADEVSREVVEPGQEGAYALRRTFGDAYFLSDGTLDRRKLAAEVFSDPMRVKLLNDTLHPLILARISNLAQNGGKRVFIDAALLIQAGMHKMVDFIWLVVAEEEVRIARVMARDGMSEEQVIKRMQSQMTDSQMKEYADAIINNGGSLDELHSQIDELLHKFLR